MESFCHQLNKPPGALHVKLDDNYLFLTVVLHDRVFSTEFALDANPQAKQLLEPCDNIDVILQKRKITVQISGEDVVKNKTADSVDSHEALTQILQSFCKLSKTHAETVSKRRDAKDIKDEAVECLEKIEEQHQEDYTKFILIHNEKKKKIRELKRKLGLREDDPEDIEDEIGVRSSEDTFPRSKNARKSDQLALEGPSASAEASGSRGEDDGGMEADLEAASDDDEVLSEEEHSDRAQSEVEEIDGDDPLTPEIAVERGEEAADKRLEAMTGEKLPADDDGHLESGHVTLQRNPERPIGKPQAKKDTLDLRSRSPILTISRGSHDLRREERPGLSQETGDDGHTSSKYKLSETRERLIRKALEAELKSGKWAGPISRDQAREKALSRRDYSG